jgi:hypothetical protein
MAYRRLTLEERIARRPVVSDYALALEYARLVKKIEKYATGNTAPIPLAMNQEYDKDGQLVWYVMIHVRLPGVTEYEVEASAITLPDALSHASRALGSQHLLRTGALRDGEVFGYTF